MLISLEVTADISWKVSPLVGLSMPIWWALRDHVMGIDSPCIGHLLPVTAGIECPKFGTVSGPKLYGTR